jgi:hypothetical protein
MKVLCVKWGSKYGAEWVTRLRSMVARHLSCAHEFVCFTDAPVEGVTCKPLPSGLPTWWSKLGLFQAGLTTGPNLYLDLDVIIRGDLSDFIRLDDGQVWALDDFSYSLRTPKPYMDESTRRMLGGAGTCNSSVMFWYGDAGRKVWDDFRPEVMGELHGDQNWITRALYPHTLALYPPGLASSFKYHWRRDEQFGSVVVFHGSPKPPDLPRNHALRMLWEAA